MGIKITELTEHQVSLLDTYRDKWIKIGLSTERFDLDVAKPIINDFYINILDKKKIVPIIIMDDPIEAWNAAVIMWSIFNNNEKINSESQLQVDRDFLEQISSQIQGQIEEHAWKDIDFKIKNRIYPKVDLVFPYIYGSMDVWYSYYDYIDKEVLSLDKSDLLSITYKLSKLGFTWCCDDFCVVSQKPSLIKKNDKGLHCEDGPALSYGGKLFENIYSLNGVAVPKELVLTPSEKLNIDFFVKEKNADVKAEFVRKFGIARMANMGKIIDTWKNYKSNRWWVKSEYELIDMSPIFSNVNFAPHVKMKNQTTGIYHLEAVSPECNSLEKAMSFRQNNKEDLDTLTIK